MSLEDINKFLKDIPADIGIKEVLDLPLAHIKDISPEVQKTLEKTLDVHTISDFAEKVLTHSKMHLLKILSISENDLEKWQAVASYITNVARGIADVDIKMKILLAGLDNAGKTAILNVLTKRFNITNLKPTIEVDITQLSTENVTFVIWDMGGQEQYRKKYIANPERFFVNVQSVIYVIDVQNREDYEKSKSYLVKILDILESFQEYPDFFVFLHKADPGVIEQIQNELDDCKKIIENTFEGRPFQFRVFHTSIYNTILTGENFADSLANLFALENRKETSPDLLNSMQLVYNNFINLSYVIENLEKRVAELEAQNSQLLGTISTSAPKDLPTKLLSLKPVEKPPLSPRQALREELKALFRKKGLD